MLSYLYKVSSFFIKHKIEILHMLFNMKLDYEDVWMTLIYIAISSHKNSRYNIYN